MKMLFIINLFLIFCFNSLIAECIDSNKVIYLTKQSKCYYEIANKPGRNPFAPSLPHDSLVSAFKIIDCYHTDSVMYYKVSSGLSNYYIKSNDVIFDYDVAKDLAQKNKNEQDKRNEQLYKGSSSSEHNWQTGPRGGKYYINDKGKKVYKKK